MHRSLNLRRALLGAALLTPVSLSGCGAVMSGLETAAIRHNARTAAAGAASRPDADAPVDAGAAAPETVVDPGQGQPDSQDAPPRGRPAAAEPEATAKSGFWPRVVLAAPLATSTPLPRPTSTRPPTSTPDLFAAAGNPSRLEIPALGVDAAIEQVGLTRERAMDVPKGWMNAGWYVGGFRPGEPGNAVVAGHLDSNTGGPAIFWDLNKLVPGDEVYIVYESGLRLGFRVEGNQLYQHDADGPIIDAIFGASQTADLNLVTCDGAWDYGAATYSERLVVFTTLIEGQSVSSASP